MSVIILDRDGVINVDSTEYIKSADEWHAIDGSIEAIADLSKAGHRVFVATNQSGLAREFFSLSHLHLIHEKMQGLVKAAGGKIEHIFFCPHHPNDGCSCRKPKTGMLEQLEQHLGHKLSDAIVIGDSRKDLDMALNKNCRPILVLTGNGQQTQKQLPNTHTPIPIFSNLRAAANSLLSDGECNAQ